MAEGSIRYDFPKSSNKYVSEPVSIDSNADGDTPVNDMTTLTGDDLILKGRENARSRTGLSSLEAKVKALEEQGGTSNPAYVRLKAKLDKKNLRRQARAAKKNIRKFGAQADLGATNFMDNIDAGSVGETQSRVKKRFKKFLDRTDNTKLFKDLSTTRDINIAKEKEEKAKIARENQAKLKKEKTDFKNNVLADPKLETPDYNAIEKRGRPFIAHTNSITAGQPIRKMLKNFR